MPGWVIFIFCISSVLVKENEKKKQEQEAEAARLRAEIEKATEEKNREREEQLRQELDSIKYSRSYKAMQKIKKMR